ncbi:MAG: nucleotidyltransferase family protein [Oscillospiraceae bacterium]|nr:nucleotidyltransferase family protein [Oscillospiraceae bacterium]
MKTAGIIAEYNPFHSGHQFHLAQTKERLGPQGAVVCVMSGNWVQRGGAALLSKQARTAMALRGGADLVLELPTLWAAASAERFARGGVELLHAAGVIDVLSFGSEDGVLDHLRTVADCLDTPACQAELRRRADGGMPFAAARRAAVRALLGPEADCLDQPNNNLGVEYLRALRALQSRITPMTIPRQGAGHHAAESSGGTASASALRRWIEAGDWNRAEGFLSETDKLLLAEEQAAGRAPASLERCERAVLARLRTMAAGDWAALPDSGGEEGLPHRLVRAAGEARTIEEFWRLAKTRRYAHARLRRLTLWAFLGLRAVELPEHVPYLRVLGFGERGKALLREMKERAALPVLVKPAHARRLDEAGQRVFSLEVGWTDLYGLCQPAVPPCGEEWRRGPVVL